MKNVFVFAGMLALATALAPSALLAAGKSNASVNANDNGLRGFARADEAAGTHGLKGRNVARTRGSHTTGFCPPGQKKKLGNGSRFAC